MNKNKRTPSFIIFMFSLTAALGFIAVDVITHSAPSKTVQADTSWSK